MWPQWQGVGTISVQQLASEFPFEVGRRGYAVGSAVLEAVLPARGSSAVVGAVGGITGVIAPRGPVDLCQRHAKSAVASSLVGPDRDGKFSLVRSPVAGCHPSGSHGIVKNRRPTYTTQGAQTVRLGRLYEARINGRDREAVRHIPGALWNDKS